MQGGPLDHVIAAKAVALAEALKPEFTQYQKQVLANAKVLEAVFKENNITMVSGGTDNHLLLLDLTNLDISGQQAVTALDSVGIFTNKNMIPFDKRKPTDPSGIRLGTAALTTRGIKEDDMKLIGQFIVAVLKNIDKQDVLDNIKKQIGELIAKYPLYPNINYG